MDRKDCDNQYGEPQGSLIRRRAGVWGCAILLCWGAELSAETVRLRTAGIADGHHVRLGEIADLEGFEEDWHRRLVELPIARAPQVGERVALPADQVRERLQSAGINLAFVLIKGASYCVVSRPVPLAGAHGNPTGVDVGARHPQSLGARIEQAIGERLAAYGGEVEVDFDRRSAALLLLSEPTYSFDIKLDERRELGALGVEVVIQRPDHDPQVQRLTVNTTLLKSVVVATRTISRGRMISKEDVALERRSFRRLEHIGVTDPAAVIGQEARRHLRAGQIIERADIKSKILVRSNDLVRVRSLGEGIVLEGSARALESGTLDDVIEVQSAARELFWVRITGLRQAQALDPGAEAAVADSRTGAAR